ncbi:very short patch repair endonuclease [Pedobacter changchengzhani]|uniref:Very short patch repair endonuclease n=1 Tax=Pedobacter changchengzhani TaxID=2529274 RepID=A0A4R5MIG2_9SPHI|nr:very short patch repair endonuclease [Pedobacter changchengzhani]TDG35344.1 very short patch repair endonuclease [Pedobacter changchengzhani]
MAHKPYYIDEEIIKVPRFEESAGFYTTKQRSANMGKIKGKNSIPELLLRKALWAKNIRYRIHKKNLPGCPDLVINKYRLAIFVDGDFWHGYNWAQKRDAIKSNALFWIPKIERNMQKDRHANASLIKMGYTVMRFWEHEVKHNLSTCVNQILLYVEACKENKIPTIE